MLQSMARGIDDRAVETHHERKSVGAENTFPGTYPTALNCGGATPARPWDRGAPANKGVRARTVVLKLRYSNFKTITRQQSLASPTDDLEEVLRRANELLNAVARPDDTFRLLGIHATNLVGEKGEEEPGPQLPLWPWR